MIIIATEEEKDELFKLCNGECRNCVFYSVEHCLIDDRHIITVDVVKTDTIHALLKNEDC